MADHAAHEPGIPHTQLGHTNPWPFTAGVGLLLVFFGLLPIAYNNPGGWLLIVMGFGLFGIAVAAWLGTLSREDISEARGLTQPEFPRIAPWFTGFLILSEIFLFGGLFASYFYLRNWDYIQTGSLMHFYAGGGSAPVQVWGLFPLLNTFFLVTSSVTLQIGEAYLKKGKIAVFQVLLGITVVLGVMFLASQVYEFVNFVTKDHFTLQSGTYGATFFSLTSLHGLHVTAGVILLSYLLGGSFAGQFSAKRHMAVTVIGIYWHFVDVIWIFLVAVLYLRLI